MIVHHSPPSGTLSEQNSMDGDSLPNFSDSQQRFLERVTKLSNRIEFYGNSFADGVDYEPDDIVQNICVDILELHLRDHSFLDQNDSYVTMFSKWMTLNRNSKQRTYRKHVSRLEDEYARENLDDSGWEDVIAGQDLNPEEMMCQEESLSEFLQDVFRLSPDNRKILTLIFLGYQTREIAEMIGVSSPAISQRKNVIANALSKHRPGWVSTDLPSETKHSIRKHSSKCLFYKVKSFSFHRCTDREIAKELAGMIHNLKVEDTFVSHIGLWGGNEQS